MIIAAADGSSLSNPGPAGWAWYISDEIWAAGGWEHGTNNMGELMAVLDLLRATAHVDEEIKILCDSQYVINSLTKWLPGWKRKGWKKGDGKPVLNVELMKELDTAMQGREITFEWVKGHAGHEMNEAADVRARAAATAYQKGIEPDAGPGFPNSEHGAARTKFSVGSVEEQPDLFSVSPEPAKEIVPGSATPREKAALSTLSRKVLAGEQVVKHPDFVSHGAFASAATDSAILSIDLLGPGIGLVQVSGPGTLLWQQLPTGWALRLCAIG